MPVSASTRKRNGATTHASTATQQRERKRLQNRISQQCFREKQATYIKHLEQFVSSIEKSEGFSSSDAAEKLRLIQENHALRESLLHMRKKLLSLGAQATSLASTDEEIMGGIPVDGSQIDGVGYEVSPLDTANCSRPTGSRLEDEMGDSPPRMHATPDSLSENRPPSVLGEDNAGPSQSVEEQSERLPANHTRIVLGDSDGCKGINASHVPSDPKTTSERTDIFTWSGHSDTDISTFFAGECVKFSPLLGVIVQKPPNASTKCPLLVLETRIQSAMQQFSLRSLHEALAIRPFVNDLSNIEVQQFDNLTLTNIIRVATQAMLRASRIGGYSHVLCPASILEQVLVWRIHPTSENRNRIEAPFRPTILQQRFPNHHPTIDLLYWDELRDQLILCDEDIEIGAVVYQWILSSVIEFPDQAVAVSVLEIFAYLANPTLFALEYAVDPDLISIPLADITERDIVGDIGELLASYRLDCFHVRKLPASIAKQYPFLDMTNIITNYPIISVTQLPMVSEKMCSRLV